MNEINVLLAQIAKEQHAQLPQMNANGVEHTAVGASNGVLTHMYRLPVKQGDGTDIAAIKNNLYLGVRRGNCTDPTISFMLQEGITIKYVYMDVQGSYLFEFSIEKQDCVGL